MLIAGSREPSQCFPLYWSLYLKRRGCLCANCLCLPNKMKNCQCLEGWFSWPVIFSPDCHAVLKGPFLMPENPTQLYSSPLSFFPLSLQIPVCVFNVFTTPLSLLSLALPFYCMSHSLSVSSPTIFIILSICLDFSSPPLSLFLFTTISSFPFSPCLSRHLYISFLFCFLSLAHYLSFPLSFLFSSSLHPFNRTEQLVQ